MSRLDFRQSYDAIKDGVAVFAAKRDVVRVTGPDALSYLEGQCSQHVSELLVGESAETLLLSPQGKVEAYATVTIDDDGGALVIVDEGFGEDTYNRLKRFKIRVKAELELVTWNVFMVRGPKAAESFVGGSYEAKFDVSWPGCSGFDVIGPTVHLDGDIPNGENEALEIARIEAGIAKLGRELSEKTIPQEAELTDRTVSFTKGCYTGQELVARIDSRGGNVPRRLRSIAFDVVVTADQVQVGTSLIAENREIGDITSIGFSPRLGGLVGLAYIRRDVEIPANASIGSADAKVATISEIPLVT